MGAIADISKTTQTGMVSAAGNVICAVVRSMALETPGTLSMELVPVDRRPLPAFEPGAHIDLMLPNNAVRQYSLCGDPSDRSHYRIGIRAVAGGRSSDFVHNKLRPGDVVGLSLPRNNFPLVESGNYIFVAGGIGITPFIPMMRELGRRNRRWTLLYCIRRVEDAPFLQEIRRLGGTISLHSSEAGTRLDAASRLAAPEADTVIYCCGPEKLMIAVEAATSAWPAGAVRFEWFAPRSGDADPSSASFEVVCQASGLTVTVSPQQSVLQAVVEAGIDVMRSCEQGICGACECRVAAGEVDHRDSVLTPAQRAANRTMMICVSRAKGARLVLDI